VHEVAQKIGVGVATLERWRSEALIEATRNAWRHEHRVYLQDLAQWRQAVTRALAMREETRAPPLADQTGSASRQGAQTRAALQGDCPG
jgi:transposase